MKADSRSTAIVFLICLILSSCSLGGNYAKACFEDSTCIQAEVVDEPKEMQRGLMGRTMLPEDRGMLFIFQNDDAHGIWMKNMAISIDIIWLDQDRKIVHIERDARPCVEEPCKVYYPENPARYVIEVQSGFSDTKGLEVGQKVSLG